MTLTMEALRAFKTPAYLHPRAENNIPEGLKLQQHRCFCPFEHYETGAFWEEIVTSFFSWNELFHLV
jgi:hypothetical protein